MLGDDLHLPALLIERQPPAQQDVQPVLRAKAQQRCLAAKEYRAKLALVILKREVNVAGSGRAQVTDFALNPQVRELALNAGAQLRDEVAHLPNVALGLLLCGLKAEAKLRFLHT